jgi:two-component system, cell cycle sensor histidine kinase and response regulator CckA
LFGYWLTDENGKFLDVNDAYCRMSGYTREELLNLSIPDIEHSEKPEETARHIQKVLETGRDQFESKHKTKDGRVFDAEVDVAYWQSTRRFIVFIRDITERKRAAEAIQISEKRLKEAQQMAHVGNWEFNISSGNIWASDTAFRMYGLTPSADNELDINEVEACVPEKEKVHQALVDLINDGKPYDIEIGVNPANGESPRIMHSVAHCVRDKESVPMRVVGVIQDITERKLAEERLKTQMEFITTLLDTIPSPVFYKDVSGRYLGCNRAFEEFQGRSRESIIGKGVHDMSPGDIAEKYEAMDKELFARSGRQTYEWKVSAADGSKKDVIFNKATFLDSSGNISGLVGVILDITELKRKEQLILQSEKKFEATFHSSPDVTAITDTHNGTLLDVNNEFVNWSGYSREELIGRTTKELNIWDNLDERARIIGQIRSGIPVDKEEVTFRTKNGKLRQMLFSARVIEVEDKPILLSHAQDITERKQTEEALREQEIQYRRLIDQAADGIFVTAADGRFLLVNSKCCELLGYTEDELYLRNILDTYPEESRDLGRQRLMRLKSGESLRFERPMRRKDGSLFIAEASASKLDDGRLQAIIHDVTQRKRTEEELQKQHDLLAQLVETSPVGIAFVDAGGKIIFANTRAEEILGISKNDITQLEYNAPAWRITDLDGKPFPMDDLPFMQVLKTRKPVKDIQHGIEWPDGRRVLLSINGAPLISATGEFSGMVATFEDITERKALEEERIKLEERLQQSYKMEAIGSLAGGIAHDFNNILSSVFGFAELAKMRHEDGENIGNELDEILKAGVRARDLVKQILTFSRQAGIKREPMVVVPLIKETLKFLRASLPVTIEIRQDFPVSDSMIIADPTQIHQVIMNLCTNAAYAMKEKGGMLDVRLAEVELDDAAELDYKGLEQGRYLRLSVSDTGSGIQKEIIKRIFDPFFTTKERGEGTGMGLSVVHGIVKEMGGSITVYSDPGIGTTFNILLPLYKGEAVEAHALNTLMKTGRGRILFVDDEEGVIVSGRGILEQLGYEITSTTSPMEALALFTADPDAIDLVLTDLTMPKMTGLELSERLREIRPDIPIVLCTGFSLGISPERIRDAGISEMVMKPMVASELSEAVYKVLNPVGG